MKTIGLLFDISGSMHEKFENIRNSDSMEKKSDELIKILKNISKNAESNVFTILFGLLDNPYIIDFIKLLHMSNEKFKTIETTDENSTSTVFREKLIELLSKDSNGNERYCNIREYILSPDGPSEKLSEFFCYLMEEEREIIDNIYNNLPIEVRDETENQNLQNRMNGGRGVARGAGGLFGGVFGAFGGAIIIGFGLNFIPIIGQFIGIPVIGAGAIAGGARGIEIGINAGSNIANNVIYNKTKEETIKQIKDSFKSSIEIISKKIIKEYNLENHQNYELIKGKNLSDLIENLEKKIVQPKEDSNDKNISIIDLFKNIIYGNTPLYTSFNKAIEIFEGEGKNNKKILFIISDGLLNDIRDKKTAQNNIKEKITNLDITVICIYLNSSNKLNTKTFYNEVQPDFDEGAKFLFNISSKVNYHNSIINFFIKKGWNIPSNGVCNLFIEINNSKDLNIFINLVNEALNKAEPMEEIYKIIGDSLLSKIIDENYIMQFNSENQIGGRCWAYSLSANIYLASSRVFGRKIPKFEDILNRLMQNENAWNDIEGKQGRNVFEMAKRYLRDYKLRGREISASEARISVIKGRPCLCRFYLDKKGWHNFSEFFAKHPKGILTKNDLEANHPNCIVNNKEGGHAVVLTEIEENCLKFLNSWGENFADKGYFRIKNENVIDFRYMDIFWYESDLTQEERDKYNNNYLSFIKQASNYLSDSNINIKDELKKNVKCPKCHQESSLENFELILHQNHEQNNGAELRKLQIKCNKCFRTFESDSIMILLYIYTILN